MYWQLENFFFEYENFYTIALSIQKPRYGNLEYQIFEFFLHVMGGVGIETNW